MIQLCFLLSIFVAARQVVHGATVGEDIVEHFKGMSPANFAKEFTPPLPAIKKYSLLGNGNFAATYRLQLVDGEKELALKVYKWQGGMKDLEKLTMEKLALKPELQGILPQIFPELHRQTESTEKYMALGMTLTGPDFEKLAKNKKNMSLAHLKRLAYDTIQALFKMHNKAKICHGDTGHMDNVAVDAGVGKQGHLFLIDFGYAAECKGVLDVANDVMGVLNWFLKDPILMHHSSKADRGVDDIEKMRALAYAGKWVKEQNDGQDGFMESLKKWLGAAARTLKVYTTWMPGTTSDPPFEAVTKPYTGQ